MGAVRENAAVLQRLAGQGNAAMAVVKADAYGHGAIPVARACAAAGIRHFGVACVAEGRELRDAGIKDDIYILSSTLPEEADEIIRLDLIPFVSSLKQWWAIDRAIFAARTAANNERKPAPTKPRCVLVLDSGMGREGLYFDEAQRLYENGLYWEDNPSVWLDGIATHFSSADEPGWGDAVTAEQAENFFDAIRRLTIGERDKYVYLMLANSPATLRWQPPAVGGMRGYLIRCGLLTYGIAPYPKAEAEMEGLRPVLSWRARVTLVREMPAGATVGYGQTHTLTRASRIATLAVGYADGLSRNLSNRGVISLHGARYKIVGRVSMDQCQVDVTAAGDSVAVGDVATLIGSDGAQTLTVGQMAEQSETTPHEPTCRLSARVPRIYVGGN